jgi:hypothetical protein
MILMRAEDWWLEFGPPSRSAIYNKPPPDIIGDNLNDG